ncbi:MAG: PASTA domain-containing protein [Propionibacteriales bacterium]|nr:PASTA domain-containing protein [Propionibacteriales bacterium]
MSTSPAGEEKPARSPFWGWPVRITVVAAVVALIVVAVILGRGGDDKAIVPSVVGLGHAAADGTLVSNGFSTQIERQPSSEPSGIVIGQDPVAGAQLGAGGVVTLTISGEPGGGSGGGSDEQPSGPVEMPDVVGEQYVLAGAELEQQGLVPDTRVVERGRTWGAVIAQRPRPGTTLEAGEIVQLDIALPSGFNRLDVPVPDLEGLTAASARTTGHELGFTMRTEEREAPSLDLAGKVLSQEPKPGTTVAELSQIRIVVGG